MKAPGLQQDRRRRLAALASSQGGYFTARQAVDAGYSPPLQHHHTRTGNWQRIERRIYRLPEWPSGAHEGFIIASLWSSGKGVVSHDSALAFHELSDVLPDTVHLTVPPGFRKRREGVTLHKTRLNPSDVAIRLGFQVTTPLRTIADAAVSDLSPEHLERAVHDGLKRGLLRRVSLIDLALGLPREAAVRLRSALKAAEQSA